jgi:gluconolactonase
VIETVVATGFSYPEGPCFDANGTLHAVELAGGVVSRIIDGQRVVLATPGGSPNGAAFDDAGSLWICNNGGNWGPNASTGGRPGLGGGLAAIQVVDPDGSFATVLSAIDDRPLASPNDLALDPRGGMWFTDPVWATRDRSGSALAAASPPGSVCFLADDGTARRCHTGLVFPNGLVLTPDGGELLVDETGTGRIHAFPVLGPGRLGDPRVRWELGPDAYPDGMCLDSAGRLIVAGTGSGALFVVGERGLEARIDMADPDVTNVCFGGPDGRTLFVTEASLGRVVSLRWDVPGQPLPVGPRPW